MKMHKLYPVFCLLLLELIMVSGYEMKERKGKKVEFDDQGNVGITLNRKKWSSEKGRFLCCPLAAKHCRVRIF